MTMRMAKVPTDFCLCVARANLCDNFVSLWMDQTSFARIPFLVCFWKELNIEAIASQ